MSFGCVKVVNKMLREDAQGKIHIIIAFETSTKEWIFIIVKRRLEQQL